MDGDTHPCVYIHLYIPVNVHVVLYLHGAFPPHICIFLGFFKILAVLVNK